MKSEREKMLAGELYNPLDPELVAERQHARRLFKLLNDSSVELVSARLQLIKELIPRSGASVWIEPPFYCDYGSNVTLGDRVYFNFNCTILDTATVTIGAGVKFGPGVHIYTATHPLNAAARNSGLEFSRPIEIGDDVWIGGGAIVCPGVKIGARAVIGAGSVVTKDLPVGVVAVGNPCRVLRSIAASSIPTKTIE
jgi:maltose O-acetyltransferase